MVRTATRRLDGEADETDETVAAATDSSARGRRSRRSGRSSRAARKSRSGWPRRAHPNRWRWIIVGLVTLVAGGAVGWVLYFSPLFGVSDVAVTGTTTVDPADVLAAADIAPGTPLLRVDTGAVEAKVGAIAEIESVTVSRSWPDVVSIKVVERQPLAVVAVDDRQWLVDHNAVLYRPVDELPGGVPPGVVALDVAHAGSHDAATKSAVSVVASLAPDVRGLLALVTAPSPNSVTLALTDGRTVIWGGPDDAQRKADVLAALLTQPGSVYDVSSPEMAIVR